MNNCDIPAPWLKAVFKDIKKDADEKIKNLKKISKKKYDTIQEELKVTTEDCDHAQSKNNIIKTFYLILIVILIIVAAYFFFKSKV